LRIVKSDADTYADAYAHTNTYADAYAYPNADSGADSDCRWPAGHF